MHSCSRPDDEDLFVMGASSDLRRLTEKLVYPSTPLTHTHSLSAVCIPLRPSEAAQHLLCKSHTHAARVHREVLDRVRRWTSVTPCPFHLRGGLHCQRHKRGRPGCYVTLTSRDFVCSSLFVFLCTKLYLLHT